MARILHYSIAVLSVGCAGVEEGVSPGAEAWLGHGVAHHGAVWGWGKGTRGPEPLKWCVLQLWTPWWVLSASVVSRGRVLRSPSWLLSAEEVVCARAGLCL